MKKILDMIKGFFAKDLLLKILSLLIAIVLWFVVMNTLNPTETKAFTTNLTFINEATLTEGEEALTIINKADIENTKVTVKVKGTRPALDELSEPNNRAQISAYIDLKQLNSLTLADSDDSQKVMLTVTPKLPNNIYAYSYEIVSYTPNIIEVEIDKLKSETMRLQIDVSGQLKSGYNANEPVCETDTVKVIGPQSMFKNVSAVRASVDITGKTSDVNVSVAPAVYDTEGNLLELFKIEPAIIDITIDINRQWQIPVNEPEVIGELNENLVLESITFEPKNVEVEGTIEDINKVSNIELPVIDLGVIQHTETFSYDIRPSLKDTDLKLKEGTPNEIKVTVTVKAKASRDITITQEDFTVNNLNSEYVADIEDVNLTVYGAQEIIDTVTAKQLMPTVDLTNKSMGWNNLIFSVTLPEGVEIRTEPRVTVVLRNREEESETESETQTQEPVTEEETVEQMSEEEPVTEENVQ